MTPLDAIYASHPINERNILARLGRQHVSLSGLTEWSLAVDPDTELTDQNHPGGVQSVLALAAAARISAASMVVDVGAGLAGSARVLAHAIGCSVVAIEQDRERCRQAARLTSLVGLSHRVKVVEHDALVGTSGITNADVLFGQSAWAHFQSPERFLDLWLPALRVSGRVAMADAFLLRDPCGPEEFRLLRELEQHWAVHLVSIDRWRRALEARRCATVHLRHRAGEARAYFRDTLAISSTWPEGTLSSGERRGWALAADALQRGILTTCQLVAVKSA